jgi:hypothetical protein
MQQKLSPHLIFFTKNMPKIAFGWGFAPDHTRQTHNAPPDPLAALKGQLSGRVREKEGKGERERRGRVGRREEREGEGSLPDPPARFSQIGRCALLISSC